MRKTKIFSILSLFHHLLIFYPLIFFILQTKRILNKNWVIKDKKLLRKLPKKIKKLLKNYQKNKKLQKVRKVFKKLLLTQLKSKLFYFFMDCCVSPSREELLAFSDEWYQNFALFFLRVLKNFLLFTWIVSTFSRVVSCVNGR